jgi:hypothetical protein
MAVPGLQGEDMPHTTPRPIDTAMVAVVDAMAQTIVSITNQSVQNILETSSRFMTETSKKALQDFHRLYFSADALSIQKDDVNADVDLLFEAIQKTLAEGGDPNEIQESEQDKTVRLGLAALQKQLESIVQLDRGMREKLMPAIMSMQFEDATRQRLNHIKEMWELVAQNAHESSETLQNIVNEQMKTKLSTSVEKGLFYPTVLGETPPTMISTSETWLNSLI